LNKPVIEEKRLSYGEYGEINQQKLNTL
jgi:hypothetical protein